MKNDVSAFSAVSLLDGDLY